MIRRDYHVHTTFCDGHDSPTEVAKAAYEQGVTSLGFVAHSDTYFDRSYCLKEQDYATYLAEISSLKAAYDGKMEILCGIEQDYYSLAPTDSFDFVIGSVHYLKCGKEFIPIDESAQILQDAIARCFGGDVYAMVEAYFATVADVVNRTSCTILGHFDLIAKFHEVCPLFDQTHVRYVAAYQSAIDALVPYGIPFEINTGAISRALRTTPYPSADILAYLKQKGGRVLLSSDSHKKETLCFQFDQWEQVAKELGFDLA